MALAAPWYVHPVQTTHWEWLRSADIGIAVFNVHDGPGAQIEPSYRDAIAGPFRPAILGYVDVAYGRRSFRDILRDAERWREWYGVTGLFLDQVPTEGVSGHWQVSRVLDLRQEGFAFVAANCGTAPEDVVLETADLTCVCELDWQTYQMQPPSKRLLRHPPERQWHLVHSVPPWASLDLSRQARARGAAWTWATRGLLPNPWALGWEGQ
ncbi:MAG: spherulation-specific family 4 protein [Propionibacteriaceae bacterium]|nr:spherulation-specific family 4 protein [Propionibacteriaceae bacterium]